MLPIAILAGGLATRLRPITETLPKALIEVAGEPFLAHQLRLLRRHGFERVVLCVGYLGEKIGAFAGDGRAFGLHVEYAFDGPQLLGTAGALRRALPLLGDAFAVIYGDSYLPCDYRAALAAFSESGKLGLMSVYRNEGLWGGILAGVERTMAAFCDPDVTGGSAGAGQRSGCAAGHGGKQRVYRGENSTLADGGVGGSRGYHHPPDDLTSGDLASGDGCGGTDAGKRVDERNGSAVLCFRWI